MGLISESLVLVAMVVVKDGSDVDDGDDADDDDYAEDEDEGGHSVEFDSDKSWLQIFSRLMFYSSFICRFQLHKYTPN